jgi:hypothetical protein
MKARSRLYSLPTNRIVPAATHIAIRLIRLHCLTKWRLTHAGMLPWLTLLGLRR